MSRAGAILAGLLLWAAPAFAAPNVPDGAFGTGADDDGNAAVEASLLVDAKVVQPGERIRVGVLLELDRGWHIYWRNPGGSGFPTSLAWSGYGTLVEPMQWPAPDVFSEDDGATVAYGYAREALFQNDAIVTAVAGEELELAVDVDFVACKILCIPGRISLERRVPVADESEPAARATHTLFEKWARRVAVPIESQPLTVDAHFSQSAVRPGDTFRAAISFVCEGSERCRGLRPGSDPSRASFVPDATPGILLEATGSRVHPFADGVLFTLTGTATSEEPGSEEQRLRGIAKLRNADGDWTAVEIDLPLPRAAAGAEVVALDNPWLEPEPELLQTGVSLWRAMLLAMLGGLILNLMPCVLPVLAIKVFGIAERAHANRGEVLLHGAAYTAGILATMAALAAVVIALRSAGTAVGWGFQFQEPLFVASISALLVVFAMNLFGVFEIAMPGASLDVGAGATGARRSFFEGLLAVLLATPCSAPFLGTAVGFAFASSGPVIVGIFLAVGIGLALPFVAITLIPGLARLLPRSGPWMDHLRAGLGFALLATVVWLLWIVGRSVGSDGVALLLGFLVILGFGVWVYGTRQRASPDGRARIAGLVVAAATVAALAHLPLEPTAIPAEAAESNGSAAIGSTNGLGASPFAPDAIEAELAGGRPVFVYFTADWCLTCKVNERIVLHDPRVASELERLGVAAFEADWTRRDETIRAELARFGRAGVPMYLVYDPRDPDRPQLLPELLTVDVVLEALQRIEDTSSI